MTDFAADGFPAIAVDTGRRLRVNGRAAQALEVGRIRLMITGVVFSLAFLTVGARLVDATVLEGGDVPRVAATAAAGTPQGIRAEITDRNGIILATTLQAASLYADPALIIDPAEAAAALTTVLPELDYDQLVAELSTDRRFVWLKRGLTPRQHYEINRLGIPGLAFEIEEQRIYPMGNLTGHVVGFTDVDGRGIAGIERQFDVALADGGEPVALSIDVRVQALMRDELAKQIEEFSAIGGAGIVMNVHTGEVLAMVSLPDFSPYEPASVPPETRFNRTTLGVYEMGSTFKIFNTAMALDSGTSTLDERYDATKPIRVGRFTITDYHGEDRWLTVPEIFQYSSNIGSVRMALEAGSEMQQSFLREIGMMTPSPVEVPEVGAPMIPDPWREVTTMTVSFGHGMAVSPMQLTSGVAAMINGGELHPATVLRRDPTEPVPGERVISEATSDTMRRLLRLVVDEGTGAQADAEGYLVGGKTGTAEKAATGGYDRKALMSSFVAAFPMNSPEYVVFAMLDEPKGTKASYGYATGGWTAAPVVRRVIEQMGPMVGIMPVDAESPAIREAMRIDINPEGSQLASYEN